MSFERAPPVGAAKPQRLRINGGIALAIAIVVVLVGILVLFVIGMRADSDSLRRGEPSVVLRNIADAQERHRTASGALGYLNISGKSPSGQIVSFYPGPHSNDEPVRWSTTCPDDDSMVACRSFQTLNYRAGMSTWLRYGGVSGESAAECRVLTEKLGLPPPPPDLEGKPWFITLAIDGEGGRKTAWAYTSWDKKIGFVAGRVH